MKLTEKRLKEIIKEEIARMQEGPGLGGKLGKTLTRQAVQRKTYGKSEKTSARRAEMDAEKERAAALDIAVSTKSSDGFPTGITTQRWWYEQELRDEKLAPNVWTAIGTRNPISLKDLMDLEAAVPEDMMVNVGYDGEQKNAKSMLQALIAKYSQGEE